MSQENLKSQIKQLLSNHKNTRFYECFDRYECGMVLDNVASKAILNYKISLRGSYGWIKNNELWLKGLIPGSDIKLLLNRWEINRIIKTTREKQYLMIPDSIYIKNRKIKVQLMITKRINYKNKEKLESIKRKDDKKMKKYDY